MPDPTDEFDNPKLQDALRAAYTHRAGVPASLDRALHTAARQRFARHRSLRLLARWGTGLAAAAAVVIIVFLHHPAPVKPLARGDHPLTMVDALTLAKHLAAKDQVDKSWDLNHDNVIDDQDVQAIATASVSLQQNRLGKSSLPTLEHLGIAHPVGLASDFGELSRVASGIVAQPTTVSLANHPTSREVPR